MAIGAGGKLSKLKAFLRQEGGSATIEFVLWLPIVIAILLLVVDSSMLFMSRSHAMRVLQDTNRLYSVGQFTSNQQDIEAARAERLAKARDYALSRLRGLSPSATVTAAEVGNGVVRTTATMSTKEIAAIGFLGMMIDTTMVVSAEHRVES
jgi:Flp pilus assembly protein TadG